MFLILRLFGNDKVIGFADDNPALIKTVPSGSTYMHLAAREGRLDIIDLLLIVGVDITLKDDQGKQYFIRFLLKVFA